MVFTKKFLALSVFLLFQLHGNAQLLMPVAGGSVKAWVGQRIGITDVTISYGRPAVKGREGKIWGGVVHTGFKQAGYGNGNPAPWRAGANENTVIEFSTDVLIDGHPLRAGKYGFFVAYGGAGKPSTIIFSSNYTSWGSFFYEEKQAVLKMEVIPVATPQSTERLTYQFTNETDSSATVVLVWEKLAIPFVVSTNLRQLQLASIDRELQGEKGFDLRALAQAAAYLYDNDLRLGDALVYASKAAYTSPTFAMLLLKGTIMEKLKMPTADSTLRSALEKGSELEVYNYGRLLLSEKNAQKGFEVFEYNYRRFPNTFTANIGLSQGYAALGKNKEALKYANQALPQAPDAENKKVVADIITALKKES